MPIAVLCSGGADSAILLGEYAVVRPEVHPIYVRSGLVWEDIEEQAVRQFITELNAPTVRGLRVFEMPIRAVYGEHWSTSGNGTPGYHSPDEAVELPGRNLLQVAQAAIWCHLNGVPELALGLLKGNPFPDSTDTFFDLLERTANTAVGGAIRLLRPYKELTKVDVLNRGRSMPLGATFSCFHPRDGLHCGNCNKCAERRRAFAEAGMPDPTRYAMTRPCP